MVATRKVSKRRETTETVTPRIHKLPISLSEDLYCFVAELGLASLKSGGKRLSQTAVIRALIGALAESDLDLTSLRNEDDLRERIASAFKERD